MVYGYVRVSTNKQDVENQKFKITNYAKANNIIIDQWLEETVSGTKDPNKRKLGVLVNKATKDDVIICTEISRLGRSLFMVMQILNLCMLNGIHVWTVEENYRLGSDVSSAILAFAFALSAQIERDLLSQRTKAGLARRKAEGIKLGRPVGSKNKKTKLSGKEDYIRELLMQGQSYSAIARIYHVDRTTLMRFVKSRGIYGTINRNDNNDGE